MPRFSIITPSFRNSRWLKLCISSVADQTGTDWEHLVQDACSDDGTQDWLPHDRRVKAVMEKDNGMYDAINRGFDRARGDIVAWLNCDEQYLPGALSAVSAFFDQHPGVDVVFAHVVMTDEHGDFLCYRKVQTPLKNLTWISHLSTLSCATFFRRRVVHEMGYRFDTRWRVVGDGEWMLRLLRGGVRMAVLPRYTSAFAFTGDNLSVSPRAAREGAELYATAPAWAWRMRPLLRLHHRCRRLLGGMYRQSPFAYEIYTMESPEQRRRIEVARPTFRAPGVSGTL
jgi:glycosyltransferase involved in cell wall biosynthesis